MLSTNSMHLAVSISAVWVKANTYQLTPAMVLQGWSITIGIASIVPDVHCVCVCVCVCV